MMRQMSNRRANMPVSRAGGPVGMMLGICSPARPYMCDMPMCDLPRPQCRAGSRANRKLRFSRVRKFRFVLTTARVRSSLGHHT